MICCHVNIFSHLLRSYQVKHTEHRFSSVSFIYLSYTWNYLTTIKIMLEKKSTMCINKIFHKCVVLIIHFIMCPHDRNQQFEIMTQENYNIQKWYSTRKRWRNILRHMFILRSSLQFAVQHQIKAPRLSPNSRHIIVLPLTIIYWVDLW